MAVARINIPNTLGNIPAGSVVLSGIAKTQAFRFKEISTKDPVVGRVYITAVQPLALPDGTTLPSSIDLPYAPNEVNISGLNHTYQELPRPGRKPLLRYASESLIKVQFSVPITNSRNGTLTAEELLTIFRGMAVAKVDLLLVGMGGIPAGTKFRLSDFVVKSVRQNAVNQSIAIANVDFTFVESTLGDTSPIPGMIKIKDVPLPVKNIGVGDRNESNGDDANIWPVVGDAGEEAARPARTTSG